MSDADAGQLVAKSSGEIHRAPSRVRHAMNLTLIAIGIYKPSVRKKAILAAKVIGKVEVDHGETNCKTPDAATYIEKASKRKQP